MGHGKPLDHRPRLGVFAGFGKHRVVEAAVLLLPLEGVFGLEVMGGWGRGLYVEQTAGLGLFLGEAPILLVIGSQKKLSAVY